MGQAGVHLHQGGRGTVLTEPQHEPLILPQDFYETLSYLPDGTDVLEYFDQDDPQWRILKLILLRDGDGAMFLSCHSLLDLEVKEE